VKQLQAQLELPAVIAISLSAMLGSGIFVLPGIASGKTGPSIWLAYVVAALCVLPAALCKAELTTAMPSSGGTYVYLDRTFGPLAGTVAGLGLWLSLLLKCSFALVGMGVYLDVIAHLPVRGFALIIIVAIVLLNIHGIRGVSRVQTLLTTICLIVLFGLVIGGIFSFDSTRLEPFTTHGATGFLSATGFLFVSFAGVTKVAAIAEEIRNPERNLPLGILISLALVTFVYTCVSIMLVGVIDGPALAQDLRPIHSLAVAVGGPWVGLVTALVGVSTLASMANAGVLAASRFPFAMARDDLLPAPIGRLSDRFLTPVWSILLSGAVIASAILLLDVEGLAKLASAFKILIFCCVNLAVITLREAHVQWYKPAFRSPGYPLTQAFGLVAGLLLLFLMGMTAVAGFSALGSLGVLLFLVYGRHRTKRRGVLSQRGPRRDVLRSLHSSFKGLAEASAGSEAAVVVALFGHERSPETLVELGAALRDGGRLEVVHFTEVPEQTALDLELEESPLVRSVARRVRTMAAKQGLPLQFDTLVSRDVIKAIDEITSRLQSEWLVIGWSRSHASFTSRNPLGWLRSKLSCCLAVFHDGGVRYLHEIMVHVEHGTHESLVMSTAKHLASVYDAKLTLVGFVPHSAPLMHHQTEADYLDQLRGALSGLYRDVDRQRPQQSDRAGRSQRGLRPFDHGRAAYRNLWQVARGSSSDHITKTVTACSVLRLQAPLDRTHETFDWERAKEQLETMRLSEYVDRSCVVVGLEVASKHALFETLAELMGAGAGAEVDQHDVLSALWERERIHGTAARHGAGVAARHGSARPRDAYRHRDAGPTDRLRRTRATRRRCALRDAQQRRQAPLALARDVGYLEGRAGDQRARTAAQSPKRRPGHRGARKLLPSDESQLITPLKQHAFSCFFARSNRVAHLVEYL
jgi:APA family basic amino acid/polyamine antiporter